MCCYYLRAASIRRNMILLLSLDYLLRSPPTWTSCNTICLLSCATGIGLTLNNVQYTNNSVVNITDIGTDSAALFCTTTRPGCCLSNAGHEWYFPDGSWIQRTGTTYFRTRTFPGSGGGTVRLHRNPGATTTGVFHCDIPDGSGDLQSIYVGIYTTTTGESCTLKRNNLHGKSL